MQSSQSDLLLNLLSRIIDTWNHQKEEKTMKMENISDASQQRNRLIVALLFSSVCLVCICKKNSFSVMKFYVHYEERRLSILKLFGMEIQCLTLIY